MVGAAESITPRVVHRGVTLVRARLESSLRVWQARSVLFGRGVVPIRWLALGALTLAAGCGATDDLIGLNRLGSSGAGGRGGDETGGTATAAGAGGETDAAGAGGARQRSYPNLFEELLGKTEVEITAKLDADFQQLFYGDAENESIYVEVDATQAYVWDPRAMEVRADGFSNALLIAVQLDRRAEFDKLWRWADAHNVPRTGPLRGYVRLHCSLDGSACDPAVAAEPQFSATSALWLADGRWGSSGEVDYASEAARLMEATLRSATGEQTELGELIGLVDTSRQLPRLSPYASEQALTTSAAMAPAFFGLWAEKSGDARAQALADNARAFWRRLADPSTGLVPDVVTLDGGVAAGEDVFSTSCYPVPLAMALDATWFGTDAWQAQQANRLLAFFSEPLATHTYATTYTLAGVPGAPLSDTLSLEAPLSAVALAATVPFRKDFVQAVWDAKLNTGTSRKFGNLLYMMSSLLLSGRFRVY